MGLCCPSGESLELPGLPPPATAEEPAPNAALLRTVDVLMQCSLLVNENLSTECVLRRLMDEAKSLIGAETASVFLMECERKELCSTVNSTGGELRIPASAGVAGHVATTGEALVVADAYNDPRFNRAVDDKTGLKTRNILCAPLRARGGPTVGVVQLINKTGGGSLPPLAAGKKPERPESFTGDDLELLQVFASQVAATVSNGWARAGKSQSTNQQPDSSEAVDEPSVPLSADVEEILGAALSSWEVDALKLADLTGRRPLSTLGLRMFDTLGLVDRFRLNRPKLARFLLEIEAGYDNTMPYHNRAHAASVLQLMYALLVHGGVAQAVSMEGDGQLEIMAGLLAAAIHDFEHKGVTNAFLVQTGDERALRFNDKHANENHHVAGAFDVLRRPECNFLAELSSAEYKRLRALVVDLVLATDMADGAQLVKNFTNTLQSAGINPSAGAHSGEPRAFAASSDADVTACLQIALKCADVGHLTLSPEAHSVWVDLLQTEFFLQGDREKELKFPEVSFLMDRDKPGVADTQTGFFDFVALPLFRALVSAFPKAAPMLSAVMLNHEFWRNSEAAKQAKK